VAALRRRWSARGRGLPAIFPRAAPAAVRTRPPVARTSNVSGRLHPASRSRPPGPAGRYLGDWCGSRSRLAGRLRGTAASAGGAFRIEVAVPGRAGPGASPAPGRGGRPRRAHWSVTHARCGARGERQAATAPNSGAVPRQTRSAPHRPAASSVRSSHQPSSAEVGSTAAAANAIASP
jgi:hypothetical protein